MREIKKSTSFTATVKDAETISAIMKDQMEHTMVLPEIGLPWAGHPSPGITIDLTSVKLNNVKFLTCISFNNNDVATDNLLGIDVDYVSYEE